MNRILTLKTLTKEELDDFLSYEGPISFICMENDIIFWLWYKTETERHICYHAEGMRTYLSEQNISSSEWDIQKGGGRIEVKKESLKPDFYFCENSGKYGFPLEEPFLQVIDNTTSVYFTVSYDKTRYKKEWKITKDKKEEEEKLKEEEEKLVDLEKSFFSFLRQGKITKIKQGIENIKSNLKSM